MSVRMCVMMRAGRSFFECQWIDPVTGRKRTRSTGTNVRREAERFAAKLLSQIESGEPEPANATWDDLVRAFKAEVFPGLRVKTQRKLASTLTLVSTEIRPRYAAALNEPQIAELVKYLRSKGRSEYTVRGHVANLRNVLKWAKGRRLLARVPTIPSIPEPPEPMRGRAITREEFDRMLAVTADVVGQDQAPSWKRLLEGLWLSGLRLGEAMSLHWTEERLLSVDLGGERPMFRIQAAGEKAGTFRLLPMTPDFATWLLKTPKHDRHGYVFDPAPLHKGGRPSEDWASKVIADIGQEANVKAGERMGGQVKYASAHDLRRAFGSRWARKVRAPLLMALMRHQSITTTMRFYARIDAEAAAAELWKDEPAHGQPNTLANTRQKSPRRRHDDRS